MRRSVPANRSAKEFALGDWTGVLMIRVPLPAKHVVEDGRELAVADADEELELANAFAEVREQVAGLLGGPYPGGVRGNTQDVHPVGLDLYHEEHAQALEEHGVDVEEVTCQDSGCLGGEKLPPGPWRPARTCPARVWTARDCIDTKLVRAKPVRTILIDMSRVNADMTDADTTDAMFSPVPFPDVWGKA